MSELETARRASKLETAKRLVEGTIERGFEPIAFAADPARGIDYPVVIIEISPEEYSSVQKNGPVRFGNHDWDLGEEIARA